jgi:Domain of unknown function (DUF4440)
MRLPLYVVAFSICFGPLIAAPDTPAAAVQALFDAMNAHDAAAAKALVIPEATLFAVHDDGKLSVTGFDKFAERIGSSKDALLERMWNPKVMEHGSIAVVWAEYDFHLNNKFHHCGVDSVSLVKTLDGWKISSIAYTAETNGCAPSPLGPPDGK